jgi:hypothetical protein
VLTSLHVYNKYTHMARTDGIGQHCSFKRLPKTKHLTSHRMVFLRISQVKDSKECRSARENIKEYRYGRERFQAVYDACSA